MIPTRTYGLLIVSWLINHRLLDWHLLAFPIFDFIPMKHLLIIIKALRNGLKEVLS